MAASDRPDYAEQLVALGADQHFDVARVAVKRRGVGRKGLVAMWAFGHCAEPTTRPLQRERTAAMRPLFNECPCGAAISLPMNHPQRDELAGRFEDKHRPHRIAAAQKVLDERTEG